MFLPVDTNTQIYLFVVVAVLAFFLATAMDSVLGVDGFGVIGNQTIIISGFYLGWFVARRYHFPLSDFDNVVVSGLVGAFVMLTLLSIIKAVLSRM